MEHTAPRAMLFAISRHTDQARKLTYFSSPAKTGNEPRSMRSEGGLGDAAAAATMMMMMMMMMVLRLSVLSINAAM